MTEGLTITKKVHFKRGRASRKVMKEGPPPKVKPLGPVPRVSRLMALAIHMEGLVRQGKVADYAELARLAKVSRPRITQIMNLLHLAPDIQEEILFLPRTNGRRAPVSETMLRPITQIIDWKRQRKMWGKIRRKGYGRG